MSTPEEVGEVRASRAVEPGPDDWRMDAEVAAGHQQDARVAMAWTARCADGTVCDISIAEAQSAVDSRRALRVGRTAIRWLQPGEDRLEVLREEASRIAEEQEEPRHKVLLLLAGLNRLVIDADREAGRVAAEALVGVHERAVESRRRHRRILRRHARELRRAHGLRADSPISALAVPRHSRRPPLNAKHWGQRLMGAAVCGGFTRDAVRLAGR